MWLFPERLPLFTLFEMDIDFGTEAYLNIKYNYLQVSFFKKLLRVKHNFIAKQVKAMKNILMILAEKNCLEEHSRNFPIK